MRALRAAPPHAAQLPLGTRRRRQPRGCAASSSSGAASAGAAGRPAALPPPPPPWWRAPRTRTLPNGLRLEYVSAPDVAFFYEEVFVQRCYTPAEHGIPPLSPGDVVVDVGANIGVFSLYAAAAVAPGGTVLAVEPVPRTCEVLRRNVERNAAATAPGVDVRVRCLGLAAADDDDASIVFYPRAAGLSSLHVDDAEARPRAAALRFDSCSACAPER
jgi:FkbM family methyltransferase